MNPCAIQDETKTCGNCIHCDGEECDIDGQEIWEDNPACDDWDER